jgi:hypothetical protein
VILIILVPMQVLETDYEVQKLLAPFLKSPSLRSVIQSFVNDDNGDFAKWAANPMVIKMLTRAKQVLDEGAMTEEEMGTSFSNYFQVLLGSSDLYSRGHLLPRVWVSSVQAPCHMSVYTTAGTGDHQQQTLCFCNFSRAAYAAGIRSACACIE